MRRRACHALRQARSLASDEAAAASERARAAAALLREQPAAGPPLIFDRRVKTAQARERSLPSLSSSSQPLTLSQRGRAAWLARNDEPLQREVAERLVERLQDVRRAFPTALVLGGSHLAVAACLGAGLGGVTRLVHLDSSADVLSAVARSPVPSGCSRELVLGDEEAVPLPPASVDVVLACLSLHWLNDLPGCLIQARRALRPDGLLLAAFFGGSTLNELRIACAVGEQERQGGVSVRVSPLAHVRDAGALLGRAGFALPAVDTDTLTVRYPSPVEVVAHLREMGEANAAVDRRKGLPRDTALATAAAYAALFAADDGTVPATWQVIYMAGWSPAEGQPTAAPRGSATVSFADLAALDTKGADSVEK